ncbi:MAG: hypothetical protein RLZZ157_123 [Pseudomonadota bacterium]|jgi:hypothetical protein
MRPASGAQKRANAYRPFAPPSHGGAAERSEAEGVFLAAEAPSVRFAATSPAVAGEDKAHMRPASGAQ